MTLLRSSIAAATLALASVASADVLYQSGTQTGSRFNPGSESTTTYMNVFVAVGAGQTAINLSDVTAGIRRISSGGLLTAVDVELFAARMTYDIGTDTYGADIDNQFSLGSFGLGADASGSLTQLVTATGLNSITIDLETSSQAGFGGFWIGLRFKGANAANANNGWRIVNVPTVGASIDAFGMHNYQNSGAFESFFNFTDAAGAPTASRFYVDVSGALVPAPGAVALLGLAGLAGRRRRLDR